MDHTQADTMKYLEKLSGAWIGKGTGAFPTIVPFQYRETLTFTPGEGKAYLHYEQRTWRKDESGREMASHWESGFWRVLGDNEVELACAQVGRVEVARGRLVPTENGFSLRLQSSLFGNDARMQQTLREFILRGSTLRYTLQMQTTAVPVLAMHVQAELRRNG